MKVLVTGASRGIGYEISKQLLESNHNVVMHCNQNKKALEGLQKKHANKSHIVTADLSNLKEIKELINTTINKFDFPDAIINNAGIAESSYINIAIEEWSNLYDRTININLKAPSLLCKEFIMIKREKEIKSKFRIINIASRAAFRGEEEDFISYACSKGGMISLTKTLSRSFGKRDNVIPFSIAPGFVKTEMAKSFIDQHGEAMASKGIVLGELTEPKDIAPLVNFIVSGKMDHCVGSTIDVNGGSYLR